MLYPGQKAAASVPIPHPLPVSWIGLANAPPAPPIWAKVGKFSAVQIQNLLAQIAYDISGWDYTKIGTSNQVGRYQFTTEQLETYGLLAAGSNTAYGTDCINYIHCWQPTVINSGINNYENYFYNIKSLDAFISTTIAQEHLAYQYFVDLYTICLNSGVILLNDSTDVTAGVIYVAWTLGVGTGPTVSNPNGTGAWAWRYNNIGLGTNSYNSGRYAIAILSQ
jgi:hypothetical protein